MVLLEDSNCHAGAAKLKGKRKPDYPAADNGYIGYLHNSFYSNELGSVLDSRVSRAQHPAQFALEGRGHIVSRGIDDISVQNFQGHVASPSLLFKGKGKGWMQDFREFALRGSMLDMAIGIILGVAFGKIITSFVEDIIMPPIGLIFGHSDGSSLFINLSGERYASLAAAKAAGAATINYGLFLNSVFNFVIVAFGVFLFVRQINRLRHALMPAETVSKECPYCCSVIPTKAVRCGACTSELQVPANH